MVNESVVKVLVPIDSDKDLGLRENQVLVYAHEAG